MLLNYLKGRIKNSKISLKKSKAVIDLSVESYDHIVDNAISNHQDELNKAMKALAGITTIFLPLTVCSGMFGMNVEVPLRDVEGLGPFFGVVVGMCLASLLLFVIIRYKGWF